MLAVVVNVKVDLILFYYYYYYYCCCWLEERECVWTWGWVGIARFTSHLVLLGAQMFGTITRAFESAGITKLRWW